jgi:hypothetical protein
MSLSILIGTEVLGLVNHEKLLLTYSNEVKRGHDTSITNEITSIGLCNFSSFPLIFKALTAEIAQIMPSVPSYIPASTTVSCITTENASTNSQDHLLLYYFFQSLNRTTTKKG